MTTAGRATGAFQVEFGHVTDRLVRDAGDTLVAPKLDRLARSVLDARAIGDSLVQRGIRLFLGPEFDSWGSVLVRE